MGGAETITDWYSADKSLLSHVWSCTCNGIFKMFLYNKPMKCNRVFIHCHFNDAQLLWPYTSRYSLDSRPYPELCSVHRTVTGSVTAGVDRHEAGQCLSSPDRSYAHHHHAGAVLAKRRIRLKHISLCDMSLAVQTY